MLHSIAHPEDFGVQNDVAADLSPGSIEHFEVETTEELTEKTVIEALVAMRDESGICRDEEVTLAVRRATDHESMLDADYDAVHFQDCSAEEAAFKRKDDAKKLKAVAEEVTKGLAREATMHRLCNMPDTQFAEQLGLNQFLPNE